MSTEVQTRETMPMTSVGMAADAGGNRIRPQNLGEVVKFAEVMARAGKMLPQHLQNDVGACMAIALHALEWQMNPFAVASKSYFVNNRVAFEAQLIAAVVNTRSGIEGRLRYEYEGSLEDGSLFCRVIGILDGTECVYETPPIGSITVKNSPLWKSDPKQQLGYFGARAWARRHCPEVILGVYDRDEAAQMRDVTPTAGTGLADRLTGGSNGFQPESVDEALNGDEVSEPEIVEPEDHPEGDVIEADRQGKRAFHAGDLREPPDDLTEDETTAWLAAWDAEAEMVEAAQ